MTTVDLALLLPIVLGALFGLRRGMVLGVADLIGVLFSTMLATVTFPAAAGLIAGLISLPAFIANVAGFVLVFMVSEAALGLILLPRVAFFRRILLPTQLLRMFDRVGGLVPGAVKGTMLVGIVILALGIWPIAPPARIEIGRSEVGRQLLPWVGRLQPFFGDLAGRLDLPVPAGVTEASAEIVPIPVATRIEFDESAEEELLFLVNYERSRFGLQPLVYDRAIRDVARGHSEEMFRTGRFAHENALAIGPASRLRVGNVSFQVAGENLAYAPTARMAHDGLMASPGHRANILSPRYRRIGIGVANSPGLGRVVTQNFAD